MFKEKCCKQCRLCQVEQRQYYKKHTNTTYRTFYMDKLHTYSKHIEDETTKIIMKCFFVFCLCQSLICYKLENNIYRNYDVITPSLLNANKYKQQERRPPSDDITKHV